MRADTVSSQAGRSQSPLELDPFLFKNTSNGDDDGFPPPPPVDDDVGDIIFSFWVQPWHLGNGRFVRVRFYENISEGC